MKISNAQLGEAMQALATLGQNPLPVATGYKLVVLRKRLMPLVDAYNEKYVALIREHKQIDPVTKQVVWQNPEAPLAQREVAWKDPDIWNDVLKAFLAETNVLENIEPLHLGELGAELPPAILYQLGPLLA